MTFSEQFLREVEAVARQLDRQAIEQTAELLARVRSRGGRLFILGVGGSAGNASHAVNDFRKIVGLEAYAPTDNVSELTARTNDDGGATVFASWLQTSRLTSRDAVLILSVGGGSVEKKVSPNLVAAVDLAKRVGASILGIVGRDGGHTKRIGDEVIVVPTVDPSHVTPHTESFQAAVWHCLVFHPDLLVQQGKWESLDSAGAAR